MEERKELLKIALKKLKLVKLYIGKSIIDCFPKIDPKYHSYTRRREEEETVELILEEANQYGLRYEVDEFAKKFLKEDPTLSDLDAYVMAYNEWIK
jgi:hypothetical protein|tara:strand:+ start:81 stop:368 length:288 start_codon:yes stop_codon:yes gene_type:complete